MKKILFVLVILSTIYLLPHVAAAPSAVVQNDSSYISSSLGWFNVVGEVLNTGNTPLRFIFITATFKDAGGIVVDSLQGVADSQYLQPNQKAPFQITDSDAARSSRIASYTLNLEFSPAPAPLAVNLLIQNVGSSTNSLGWLEVVGEVRNAGAAGSKFTNVVGTFYDAGGKVVYVATTYTSPDTIQPNAANSFKLTLTDKAQLPKISKWILFAESDLYTSIPELMWPVIALAAALLLGCVTMRRKRG